MIMKERVKDDFQVLSLHQVNDNIKDNKVYVGR